MRGPGLARLGGWGVWGREGKGKVVRSVYKCVWRYQRVCVISAKKEKKWASQPGDPGMSRCVERGGWHSGVFENRSELDYFQAAWGRSDGVWTETFSDPEAPALCKRSGVWKRLTSSFKKFAPQIVCTNLVLCPWVARTSFLAGQQISISLAVSEKKGGEKRSSIDFCFFRSLGFNYSECIRN